LFSDRKDIRACKNHLSSKALFQKKWMKKTKEKPEINAALPGKGSLTRR